MRARIFEIKRFAVHDGDGIRTTVFFKGCPLRCLWCHNPEGLSAGAQLGYFDRKCLGCGECAEICPTKAHKLTGNFHTLERGSCIACGKCAEVCLGDALTLYGKEMTSEELLPILLEDKSFYETSGGGVTLSGGECLTQADFCAELLKKLKSNGIHTAVDTCGAVSKEAFDKVIPFTDLFLYDLKAYDEDVHFRCTGMSNSRILENLRYLDGSGKKIEIRIPYVPGYNSDQIEKIGHFLAELNSITRIKVLAYHNYAGSKYSALNIKNTLPKVLPDQEELKKVCDLLKDITSLVITS